MVENNQYVNISTYNIIDKYT